VSSYQGTIAGVIKTTLDGVAGAPTLREVRKTDVLHPVDGKSAAIIVPESAEPITQTTGGGSDGATTIMRYVFGISLYSETRGDVSTGTDTNPAFVQLAKQALNVNTLAGAGTVYEGQIVTNDAWEKQAYKDGVEKTYFRMMYLSAEPKNG
jgi:hypothetical protein